jgi:hypothetical protein
MEMMSFTLWPLLLLTEVVPVTTGDKAKFCKGIIILKKPPFFKLCIIQLVTHTISHYSCNHTHKSVVINFYTS